MTPMTGVRSDHRTDEQVMLSKPIGSFSWNCGGPVPRGCHDSAARVPPGFGSMTDKKKDFEVRGNEWRMNI